jgi:hypothetical protein
MNYLDICDSLINHPDPFNMDIIEANELRFQAIHGSFEHHYKKAIRNLFSASMPERAFMRRFYHVPS